jgi:hypothetical protein
MFSGVYYGRGGVEGLGRITCTPALCSACLAARSGVYVKNEMRMREETASLETERGDSNGRRTEQERREGGGE